MPKARSGNPMVQMARTRKRRHISPRSNSSRRLSWCCPINPRIACLTLGGPPPTYISSGMPSTGGNCRRYSRCFARKRKYRTIIPLNHGMTIATGTTCCSTASTRAPPLEWRVRTDSIRHHLTTVSPLPLIALRDMPPFVARRTEAWVQDRLSLSSVVPVVFSPPCASALPTKPVSCLLADPGLGRCYLLADPGLGRSDPGLGRFDLLIEPLLTGPLIEPPGCPLYLLTSPGFRPAHLLADPGFRPAERLADRMHTHARHHGHCPHGQTGEGRATIRVGDPCV